MLSRRYTLLAANEGLCAYPHEPRIVPTFGPDLRPIQGGGLMAWWNRSKSAAADETAPVDPNMPLIRLEGITKLFQG